MRTCLDVYLSRFSSEQRPPLGAQANRDVEPLQGFTTKPSMSTTADQYHQLSDEIIIMFRFVSVKTLLMFRLYHFLRTIC